MADRVSLTTVAGLGLAFSLAMASGVAAQPLSATSAAPSSDAQIRSELRRLNTMRTTCLAQAQQAVTLQRTASAGGRLSDAEVYGHTLRDRMACVDKANQDLVRLQTQAGPTKAALFEAGAGDAASGLAAKVHTERFRAQIATWSCLACPVRFADQLGLTGVQYPDQISRAAGMLPVLTAWRVLRESHPGSTAIFVHLLDERDQIVAQDDRLGVPRHTWQPGDEFVQVHRLNLEKVPPGKYRLALGLYNRADKARWAVTDRSGQPLGDRIIVGDVEVTCWAR